MDQWDMRMMDLLKSTLLYTKFKLHSSFLFYLQAVLEQGGIQPGGLNFDAKVRRESTDIEDMFIAHIGIMQRPSNMVFDEESVIP